MKRIFLLSLLFLPKILLGDAQPHYQQPIPDPFPYQSLPWLTGTLLSSSENVVPFRSWNIEPYFLFNTQYGHYNQHWRQQSLSHANYKALSTTYVQYGFANRFDVQIVPQFSWNHTQGASEWTIGDLNVIFDFQLLYMKKDYWWPNIKLSLDGFIPIGKYQHLKQDKKGTDIGGTGSINPSAGITFGRVFEFSEFNFLRTRAFFSYTLPNPVHVRGLNTYGGGKGTCGKVFPGQSYTGVFAFEYTFTPNWVLAFDLQYVSMSKQRFKGQTITSMKMPSSENLSIAPAIEYNWNSLIGVISGVWFSVAGRNSQAFANWTSAVNINF